jgi:hypothetical protein
MMCMFRCIDVNFVYEVHIMRCVPYVGWVTNSCATVMNHLCLYKRKKKERVIIADVIKAVSSKVS